MGEVKDLKKKKGEEVQGKKKEDLSCQFACKIEGIKIIGNLLQAADDFNVDYNCDVRPIGRLIFMLSDELIDMKEQADKGKIVI